MHASTLFVCLLAVFALIASPCICDVPTNSWLKLECLEFKKNRWKASMGIKKLLRQPVTLNLACWARGYVEAAQSRAPVLNLLSMEFQVLSEGCNELFFCRDDAVRITFFNNGTEYAGNRTIYAGFSTVWNTRLSDFTQEMQQLYGPEAQQKALVFGKQQFLYMAYMEKSTVLHLLN